MHADRMCRSPLSFVCRSFTENTTTLSHDVVPFGKAPNVENQQQEQL